MSFATNTTAKSPPRAFWLTYVGVWAALALASAGYLGVSLIKPEVMAALWSTTDRAMPSHDAAIAEDVGRLRSDVDGLRTDLAEIRSTVASQGPAIARIASTLEALRSGQGERLSSAEEATRPPLAEPVRAPAVAALPTDPEPKDQTVAAAPREAFVTPSRLPPLPTRMPVALRRTVGETSHRSAKEPGSEANRDSMASLQPPAETIPGAPRMLNRNAPLPAGTGPSQGVTTGSLPKPELRPSTATPPIAAQGTATQGTAQNSAPPQPASPPLIRFGAPVVTAAAPPPSGSGAAVRLSSGPSLASLRISWQVLRQLHGNELADLEGRYRIQGANYQLLAGPFADRQQADHACSRLRAKNVSCSIDEFGGNAL